jgi:hypothetical protein
VKKAKDNDLEAQGDRLITLLSQFRTAWSEERHHDALLLMKEAYQIYKRLPKEDRRLLDDTFADEIARAAQPRDGHREIVTSPTALLEALQR